MALVSDTRSDLSWYWHMMGITESKSSVLYQIVKNHICQLHLHVCFLPGDTLGIHFFGLQQAIACRVHCNTRWKQVTMAMDTDPGECSGIAAHIYATRAMLSNSNEAQNTYSQKSRAHQVLYVLHVALAMLTQLAHVNHFLLNGLGYLCWGGGQAPQRPCLLQERWWLLLPRLQRLSRLVAELLAWQIVVLTCTSNHTLVVKHPQLVLIFLHLCVSILHAALHSGVCNST